MNWFELISIRLSNQEDRKELMSILQEVKDTAHSSIDIDFFRNVEIESDWMMRVRCGITESVIQKSKLGRVIVEALKPYGLVNHMVWEQVLEPPKRLNK